MATRTINGLKVVDAEESVILRITNADIAKATKKNQRTCAAAIACMRQLHAKEVRVHLGRTYVRFGKIWRRYITSGALRDEIVAFDRGGTFRPGEFALHKIQPHRKLDKRWNAEKRRKYARRIIKKHRIIMPDVRPVGVYV